AIATELGLSVAALYGHLACNGRLSEIYTRGRVRAGIPMRTMRNLMIRRPRPLTADDSSIMEAIANGQQRMCEIIGATRLEPNHAGALLYNLEHERHLICSQQDGHPPITRYSLRPNDDDANEKERAVKEQWDQ